jgi:transaldolase/glucose-6-phosphate isomerase
MDVAERIRAKDPTLWGSPDTPELADRLGWVDLPEKMLDRLEEIRGVVEKVLSTDPDDVVLLGMGGSSLAPEVFAAILGVPAGRPRFRVLDSTHPEQVAKVAAAIDPRRTTFIVSSKSGGTIETLSGFRYFWNATRADGARFVAITDPGSSLQSLAEERGFLATANAPADVGGRFSALTHFGLVPAGICGVDLSRLLESASKVDWSDAGALGERWGEAAQAGRDKLTFLTSPALNLFPAWMEQLIAESLGKDDKGVVPIAGEPHLDRYGDDRYFVQYRLDGEPVEAVPDDRPGEERVLSDRYALAAEMVAAEIATAAAGAVIAVHPFNQPDVELAKQRARHALEAETARVDLMDFFAPNLADRLNDLLAMMSERDYFAIHAYLPPDAATDEALAAIRHKVGNRIGNATTSGYGPRFLHSTGQLHKGGPNTGIFLQLVDSPTEDVPIPETDQTFGRLIAAQALGDYQALRERGRTVLRIDLGPNRRRALDHLVDNFA